MPIRIGTEVKESLGEPDELGSRSSESWEGAGEGKAVWEEESVVGGAMVTGVGDTEMGTGADGAGVDKGEETPVGSPCAARAFITASQPFSRVRIRALSSSFSRSFCFSLSVRGRSSSEASRGKVGPKVERGSVGGGGTRPPARSLRFSSSSSATLRSR